MAKKSQFPALSPFALKFADMIAMVGSLSAEERKAVIREAESLTETNCGWALYRIAPVIKKLCEEELEIGNMGKINFEK